MEEVSEVHTEKNLEIPQKINLEGIVAVGCDPAFKFNQGWSICKFENGKPKLIKKYTQIIKNTDISRLEEVADEFQRIIDEFKPSHFCVEQSIGFGMANVRARLSEFVGVIKLICHKNNIKVVEISPARLKLKIAGHGRATKSWMMKNIRTEFNLDNVGSEHEIDACCFPLVFFISEGYEGYTVHHQYPGKKSKPKSPKTSKTKKVK